MEQIKKWSLFIFWIVGGIIIVPLAGSFVLDLSSLKENIVIASIVFPLFVLWLVSIIYAVIHSYKNQGIEKQKRQQIEAEKRLEEKNKFKNQVENYSSLPVWKSHRGEASLTLLFFLLLNVLLSFFGIVSFTAVIIAFLVFLPLAFFIYSGHRWAMITTMILWTLDRLSIVIITGKLVLPIIIFWLILIYPLYKALEVENERIKAR